MYSCTMVAHIFVVLIMSEEKEVSEIKRQRERETNRGGKKFLARLEILRKSSRSVCSFSSSVRANRCALEVNKI